jgi:acetyl-CoA carboxylase carboxyl transferase subunit alpha
MPILLEFERPIADLEAQVERLQAQAEKNPEGLQQSLDALRKELEDLREVQYSKLTAYQRTMLSRHPERPFTLDYVDLVFTDWMELHGDRNFIDDPSVVGGLARLDGRPVVIVGHQKGRTAKEIVARNYGMPTPEGFRKGLRLMKLAERTGRPIITFVDTPGAYPGIGAEERGQAEAIAMNIMVMSKLTVPIIAVVIGEGGSGGALALATGNRILMFENSMFSVISPEACASILWRDKAQAPRAAEALRYTAPNCLAIGVADEVIPEPSTGAHRDFEAAGAALGDALRRHMAQLSELSPDELRADRYEKLRRIGAFEQVAVATGE